MEPTHLTPTEQANLTALQAWLREQGEHAKASMVASITDSHAHPHPCITNRIAFGQTLQCALPADHDGAHTAIDKHANVHAVWTDEQN